MSEGYIDSASIMNAVGALASHDSYDEWNKWTKKSITEATTLLINHELLKIAPAPSQNPLRPHIPSKLYSCYDEALFLFRHKIKNRPHKKPFDNDMLLANANFNNWVINNIDKIQKDIEATKKDESYDGWINWSVKEAWPDHSSRMDGLFNVTMIPSLSHILGVSQNDLRDLLEKTRDLNKVESWSRGHDNNKYVDLAEDAYVASTILRGKFHEELANAKRWDRTHHPIRERILSDTEEVKEFTNPLPMRFLVGIIISSAMIEDDRIKRVSMWTENTLKAVDAFEDDQFSQTFDPSLKFGKDESVEIAVETAKKIGLRLYPDKFEKIIEGMIVIGLTTAAHIFNLSLFVDIIVGMASAHIERSLQINKAIAKGLFSDEESLRNLARSSWGRIVFEE